MMFLESLLSTWSWDCILKEGRFINGFLGKDFSFDTSVNFEGLVQKLFFNQ